MNEKNLIVCKANKIVEAGYKLSLNEQRVVLACIGQVNSVDKLLTTKRFELTAREFSRLFGVSEDRAYQALKEVSEQLFERYVIIDNPDPTEPALKYTKTRWISSISYYPEKGKIALYFADLMLPYLSELKRAFTCYKLEHIGKMTCIHAIRLYELLMQWQSTGQREIEIDWLKKQLELGEGYERMDNFKAKVLNPAIKDINTHSNLQVEWTQRKSGRQVTHLLFTFSEKKSAKSATTAQATKPALTSKPTPAPRLTLREQEQKRLVEQAELEHKQRMERQAQEWRQKDRESACTDISNEFGRKMREAYLSLMTDEQVQQLQADLIAEALAKGDSITAGNIRQRGLDCVYARQPINARIANFEEKKQKYMAEQLALLGF